MADYTGPDRRYNRDRLKLQPLKGFYLTEPRMRTAVEPPLDIVTPAGDAISGRVSVKNGMVVVVDITDGYIGGIPATDRAPGFRNCVAADATGNLRPYIAYGDFDEHDVIAAGKMVALDCSDMYELKVPYFDETKNYPLGAALTFGDGGKLVPTTTTGDVIVAYVASAGPNANHSYPYAGKTPGALFTDLLHIVTGWSRVTV